MLNVIYEYRANREREVKKDIIEAQIEYLQERIEKYKSILRLTEEDATFIVDLFLLIARYMAYIVPIEEHNTITFARLLSYCPFASYGYEEGTLFLSMVETTIENKEGEAPVKYAEVRRNEKTGKLEVTGVIKTTIGRLIYNDGLPQDLGFVKRNTPESFLRLELDTEFIGNARAIGKKHLSKIVEASFRTGKAPKASYVLDAMKERGYKYSTLAALTTSVFDMKIPEEKQAIIENAEKEVSKMNIDCSWRLTG